MDIILGSIATLLSIAGALINARGKVIGFYIWICSNLLWCVYAVMKHTWPQMPMYVVYTVICIYGIIQWKNKDLK